MADKPKIWTPSFIILTTVNFISALVFYLFIVKIVEYTMLTYGSSYSAAGLMVTAYVAASLCTRLLLGNKIDTWGLKRSIIIGTVVNMVAALLYFIEGGFVFLLCVRALHGIGFGIASGALAASAALIVPPERRGEGIGYFSMAQALATGIGPFVAIILTGSGNFLILFVFSAAVTAAALAFSFFVRVPSVEKPAPVPAATGEDPGASSDKGAEAAAPASGAVAGEVAQNKRPAKAAAPAGIGKFVQISVLPLALPLLLVLVCYSGVVSFLTVFSEERSLVDASSLYFVVYSLAILLTRPPIGRRVDKKGENSVVYMTFAALAIGLAVLAFSYNGPVLLVSAALIGFGIGCTQSTIQATIVRITPKQELGRANSTFFMSMDLGSAVGPVVIGALIPFMGFTVVYVALAALALVACALYHVMYGRKQGK